MPLRPRPPAGARAGSRAEPQPTRAEQPPLRAFSRLTSPWIGGTRCQKKKRRVALRECEEGPSRPAGSKASWDRRPPPPFRPTRWMLSDPLSRSARPRFASFHARPRGAVAYFHVIWPRLGRERPLACFPSFRRKSSRSEQREWVGWDSKRLRREHFLSPLADAGWHISARIRRPLSPTAPRPPLCLSGLVAFSLQWPFCFGQARVDRSSPCSKVRRT